jgi:hypothetical protein
MFIHLLRLLERSAESFPSLLGGNWISLILPLVIFILAEGNDLRRGGLATMKTKIGKDTVILVCAYFALFIWAVIHTTYRDHVDLVASSATNRGLLQGEQSKDLTCMANLNKALSTITDKQDLIDTIQKAFVSSQAPQAQQAANIASCINNLAKMNPIIREKITVVPLAIGTVDIQGHFPIKTTDKLTGVLPKRYIFELLVITNEPERGFHGVLKCAQAFDFIETPVVGTDAGAIMVTGNSPKAIDDSSYEIRYDATNTEWNPSHPAMMRVSSKVESLRPCSFTTLE